MTIKNPKKSIYIFLQTIAFLLLLSCESPSLIATEKITKQDNSILSFVDSLNVGRKGRNKLTAIRFEKEDSSFIHIDFYTLREGIWEVKNHYEFELNGPFGIDPVLADFNNDKHLDFHYQAAMAARSANNVRRLFIYSKQGDSLLLMKNSMDYPNMVYNKHLDCIDAVLVHGCSSQVFLKIQKDSLYDFAWISHDGVTRVYEIDESGKETTLSVDSSFQYGCYTRFKTYDPLLEYTNEY